MSTSEVKSGVRTLVIGTGEYVSGYVHGKQTDSDKPIGVISVSLFDLKRRGKISSVTLCGTHGEKFPYIRQHFVDKIEKVYRDMDTSFESFPQDDQESPEAYKEAVLSMTPHRDICFIFTPDDTHYEIAMFAVQHGLHVYVAKPLVQTLEHHLKLLEAAREKGVIVAVEVHKRWDPMYSDAWTKIRNQDKFGEFSFFTSYMSQPYTQLNTFSSWVARSDISYYLNAHHVDFHCWCLTEGRHGDDGYWRPVSVTANGSEGRAREVHSQVKYDSITLLVNWVKFNNGGERARTGTAVYTASWIAPKKGDVFSQQRFFYQGSKSEVMLDQAHRGYIQVTEQDGYQSVNPLFMKYSPDPQGYFSGQTGYGYRSLEAFIDSASAVNTGTRTLDEIARSGELATIASNATILTTSILHAGCLSLQRGKSVDIHYKDFRNIVDHPPTLEE